VIKQETSFNNIRGRGIVMDNINRLVVEDRWNLQCFPKRYGSGVWVIVGPQKGIIDQIRDITDGADLEAVNLEEYFNNIGSWLPVIQAKNVEEGLRKLNEKVSSWVTNDI
jgi:hypothetical protein